MQKKHLTFPRTCTYSLALVSSLQQLCSASLSAGANPGCGVGQRGQQMGICCAKDACVLHFPSFSVDACVSKTRHGACLSPWNRTRAAAKHIIHLFEGGAKRADQWDGLWRHLLRLGEFHHSLFRRSKPYLEAIWLSHRYTCRAKDVLNMPRESQNHCWVWFS